MKIVIIRHAKVNMKWEKKYDSLSYDRACQNYDKSDVIPIQKRLSNENIIGVIYISELVRTYQTAYQLFDNTDFHVTSLLNEVPLKSFVDTEKRYPLWIWNLVGRIQWLFNNGRQPETKRQTIGRARRVIEEVENDNKDCIIITHGFFMRILIKELQSQGYTIEKQTKMIISNLDKVTATK